MEIEDIHLKEMNIPLGHRLKISKAIKIKRQEIG